MTICAYELPARCGPYETLVVEWGEDLPDTPEVKAFKEEGKRLLEEDRWEAVRVLNQFLTPKEEDLPCT